MKNLFLSIAFLSFALQLFAGNITFSVRTAATIEVHPDIKRVAIVDRTFAKKKKADKIEGLFTGEGWDGDKSIVQSAMSGLAEQLNRGGRFEIIHTTEVLQGADFAGQFPNALNWKIVNQLCKKYDVDGLIVLESFDTDLVITNGRASGEGLRFFANGAVKVDMGFRFYDPLQQSIVDQHFFSYTDQFRNVSGSIQEAITGMMNRKNMLREVSFAGGANYASRFASRWYKITRTYFQKSKKDKNLARGARLMEANDWDAALEALQLAATKGHRKTRGKAAHNIAVVHEILGNLKEAKKWATIAWGDHENKVSKDYAYQLTRRINNT